MSQTKDFPRGNSPATWQEFDRPGQAVSATPPTFAPREQATPLSSRMPKRPARLASSEPSAPVEKAELAGDGLTAATRQANATQTAGPAPAEEISTMVLPNWREELAQLRKEQEQAKASSPVAPEKKIERTTPEPPPLPRRSSNTPFPPPFEAGRDGVPQAEPSVQARASVELGKESRPAPERARPAEPPRQTPAPLPQENARTAEAIRREQHVKVWEQEKTIRQVQIQEEKQEPGPTAAIERKPLASATSSIEEQVKIEDLDTFTWQAPISPAPASSGRSPSKEERPLPAREEKNAPAVRERPPFKEESRSPVNGEARAVVKEEDNRTVVEKEPDEDIEDLPTMRLAVPETSKPDAPIKVERASTPAPKKWTIPPPDEVEDLPTRPLAASSASSAGPAGTPRASQPPVVPQTQSRERRPDANAGEAPAPFGQRVPNPPSLPGAYGSPPAARPAGQTLEAPADPLAARGRPAYPNSQPGLTFDPTLSPGPLSSPRNTQMRPESPGLPGSQPRSPLPFPDAPGQRPLQAPGDPFAQRQPQAASAFGAASASPSAIPNTSKPATEAEKPLKKRINARVLVGLSLAAVLIGGVIWFVLYQPFSVASISQPFQAYQNSTFAVSLDYAQGWSVSVDQAHSLLTFADSTHTGQARLSIATASGQVGDYLNQQVARMQMSGPKAVPAVTFAGSSWQVVQGTVTQSGVTYTMALYVTQHNNHFYMLAFQAPQSSFTRTDQTSFAHMRSSLRFL